MRPLPAALLALGLTLAGCIGAPASPEAQSAPGGAPPEVRIGERPDPTFTQIVTGPAAAPDTAATLEAPPRWVVGEWWRVRFEGVGQEPVEFVRVVAGVHEDGYVVGMPHEGWYKEAVIYHTPALGDVNLDLSYHTHDEPFLPLKWPLTADQTWETQFSGSGPMTAAVAVNDDGTAKVTFTQTSGGGPFGLIFGGSASPQENVVLELTYDPSIHEVKEFRHGTVTFSVLEHGYNFTGWVTVPRAEDLVFLHGRFGGALSFGGGAAPPVETVDVQGGFNRVTFIHAIANAVGPGGAYRERTVAPDGSEYITESIPGSSLIIQFYENNAPDGTWQLEHVAGGVGVAFIEGIAYHQYDIQLPGGAIRTDHSHEVIR